MAGMRKTFVDIARQLHEKREFKMKKQEKSTVRSTWMKTFMKITFALALVGVVLFSVTLIGNSRHDIDKLNSVDGEKSRASVEAARSLYGTFKNNEPEKLSKALAHFDSESADEIKLVLAGLENPDFLKADVVSPEFNEKLFYVRVPVQGKPRFQFTMRGEKNAFLLDGVSWCRQ